MMAIISIDVEIIFDTSEKLNGYSSASFNPDLFIGFFSIDSEKSTCSIYNVSSK